MKTNMEIRQYITHNADEIIKNNQNAAIGNCDSIILNDTNLISKIPILFDYINIYADFEINSDLKSNFLKLYNNISNMFTPIIKY